MKARAATFTPAIERQLRAVASAPIGNLSPAAVRAHLANLAQLTEDDYVLVLYFAASLAHKNEGVEQLPPALRLVHSTPTADCAGAEDAR